MKGPNRTPRKPAPADAPRYRLKERAPKHVIDGRFYVAGDVVVLPEGVKPGKWLEPLNPPAPMQEGSDSSEEARKREEEEAQRKAAELAEMAEAKRQAEEQAKASIDAKGDGKPKK